MVIGGHQTGPSNTTLKLHIEPKTQSVLVPQSSSPLASRSCKSRYSCILINGILKLFLLKQQIQKYIRYNARTQTMSYDCLLNAYNFVKWIIFFFNYTYYTRTKKNIYTRTL